MLFIHNNNFTSSFLIYLLIFFPCLIVLGGTCSMMLNRSCGNGNACLIPHLRSKAFMLIIKYYVGCRFFTAASCHVEEAPYYPQSTKSFYLFIYLYHEWVLNFFNAFCASPGIVIIFSFILLVNCANLFLNIKPTLNF